MIAISKMAAAVKPAATLAAGAKAKQMKAEGIHVFDFSIGEPDFRTPEHICQAAVQAMKEGHTHYTQAAGIPPLRAAVARWYEKSYGVHYAPEQVLISCGAKHALHNALSALCGPGDEVIIPTPYWVSYSDLVQMTGASCVFLATTMESGFKITPRQLEAAITPRTKLLMLNSPSNPTGVVYTRQELAALADCVISSGIVILSDEIYDRLIYRDAQATCFVTLRPELIDRTITINGASKAYAMTGWRIGWSLGPIHLIKAMTNIQSQQTANPCSVSQYAALAAVEGDQHCVEMMRKEFEARCELICEKLANLPDIRFLPPSGAFYAFFNISSYFGRTLAGRKVTDSASFCQAVLEVAHINLIPGSAFGMEGFARLSFANSREQLNGGLDRLEQFLTSER